MDPHELGEYALSRFPEKLRLGEFKFLDSTRMFLQTRNEIVSTFNINRKVGFGIRVLKNGAWGFAASNTLTKEAVEKAISQAIKGAEAAQRRNPNFDLTDEPVSEVTVANDVKTDPFEVPKQELSEYFINAAKVARDFSEIKFANGIYTAQKDRMVFYSNEGNKIDQTITWNGGFMTLIARGNNDTQVRKYPDDEFKTMGWEHMLSLDIANNISSVAKELVQLLEAPMMKPGKSTIILDSSQVGLQLHESCGHPAELDRALGYEAAYAGTSFLRPELLKQEFMYGNELVTIHADATIPGGLGSFFFDHEGVPAKNIPLVKEGRFVGYLSSRETAAYLGLEHSGAAMRSISFEHIPLVRMTNIMLQPGDWEFDEMIQETKEGYYFVTNRSWSIDDIRLNFQFGCEVGYKIEKGEIVGLVKNPTYTGITPEFWGSVSAVAKEKYSKVLGTPFCGKGEPGQAMYTGHGGPPTRFENVRVGVIEDQG